MRGEGDRQETVILPETDGWVVDYMLVGVMSDTHDELARTRAAVARFNCEGVELVLHAGDLISPFMLEPFRDLKAPMTAVFGNNDGDRALIARKAAAIPGLTFAGTFARLGAGGMRIGLVHGDIPALLETLIGAGSLDLLVFGHTHRPEVRTEGSLLIVNPGEVYGHLTGKSTVAIVDTERKAAEIVEV